MAAIKTKDIINSSEVSKELQVVINKMNDLIEAMNKTQSSIKKGNTSRKQMTAAQKEAAAQTKKQAALEKELLSAQKSLNKQRSKGLSAMAKEEAKQRQLVKAANMEIKSDADLNAKLAAQRKLRGQINHSLDKNNKMYRQMTASIQKLSAAQARNNKSMGVHNQNVGNYPKIAAGAIAAVAAMGMAFRQVGRYVVDVVNTFAKFDYVQAQVQAISGATAKEMGMLRNTAKELGATTEKTAQEVSTLQLNLSKLGFTVPEIDAATGAIVRLSIATGEDLAESADIMAGVMNAFGLPAEEAGRVADVMAASFSSSALNLDKFKDSMSKAAPIANELGYTIEDMSGYMAVLADSNVAAGTSSAQMRNILIKTNKAGLTLKEGLDLIYNSTDRVATATEMFGDKAAPIAVILSKNQEKAAGLTEAFYNSAGAADAMAKIMEDTLQGDIAKATSAVEALKISIGEGENGGLRGIVQGFSKVIDTLTESGFITDFLDTFKNLLSPIGKALQNIFEIIVGGEGGVNSLKNGLSGINTIIKLLLSPLVLLAETIVWLTGNIKKLGINFVPLLAALAVYSARVKIIAVTTKLASAAKAAYAVVTGVLTGKIKLAEIAQKKMNAATKANIYVAMAAAAVALGVALYKVYQNSDKVAALQKDINKAYEEATKSIGNQKAELNSLLTTAKNHNLSLTDRKAAIKKINEISPEYLGNITFENLYTTETTTAINDYNKALQNKAKQQALLSITSEKYAKVLELQYEREQLGTGKYAKKKYNDLTTEINTLNDEILQVETSFQKLFATETPTNKIDPAIQATIDKIDELWNEAALGDADALIELNNIMGTSYDKVALSTVGAADAIQAYKQSLIDASKATENLNLDTDEYNNNGGGGGGNTKDIVENWKIAADDIVEITETQFDRMLRDYMEYQKELQVKIKANRDQFEADSKKGDSDYKKRQEALAKWDLISNTDLLDQKLIELRADYEAGLLLESEYIAKRKALTDEASTATISKFEEFWGKYGEAFEKTMGAISDAISAHYENQITDLENIGTKNDAYWDARIEKEGKYWDANEQAYVTDEAAVKQLEQAKAKAAEETQAKILEIQRKQAIADKAKAIFDIAISTATGIIKALAAQNPILAAAIGVAGGVQAGVVASTPLPQYRFGLDRAETEHVGIVGDDPSGKPERVNYPDGSFALFNRPTAITLPVGASVDTAMETELNFRKMQFTANIDKLHEDSAKQLQLLSVIAKNTGRREKRISDRDIMYLTKIRK